MDMALTTTCYQTPCYYMVMYASYSKMLPTKTQKCLDSINKSVVTVDGKFASGTKNNGSVRDYMQEGSVTALVK